MAKHPHAELIKQMVDDDTLRATYGALLTECQVLSVVSSPHLDWRLVPPKPKTITIVANGKPYELPEPMRVAPARYAQYFVADHDCVYPQVWHNSEIESRNLQQQRCHATREAAQRWVDAMAEIRGAK